MKRHLNQTLFAVIAWTFLLGAGMSHAQANPCAGKNPCAAKNPCAGKNPCAAKDSKKGKEAKGKKGANPCAQKK